MIAVLAVMLYVGDHFGNTLPGTGPAVGLGDCPKANTTTVAAEKANLAMCNADANTNKFEPNDFTNTRMTRRRLEVDCQ
jgi:hypothetical protein